MKKKDFLLFLALLCLGGIGWLIYGFGMKGEEGACLKITVNKETYGIYSLEEDQEIPINDTNVCIISNGVVSMREASCPDQLCVKQKHIDSRGGTIVCLPNRVVLEITNGDDQEKIDAVVK